MNVDDKLQNVYNSPTQIMLCWCYAWHEKTGIITIWEQNATWNIELLIKISGFSGSFIYNFSLGRLVYMNVLSIKCRLRINLKVCRSKDADKVLVMVCFMVILINQESSDKY